MALEGKSGFSLLVAEKHTMMAGKEKKLLMVVVVLLATIALSVDAKPTADKGKIHFGHVS